MAAFRGALTAGAHAIETDVHLSRDGVVVLAHDPSLRRCFGVDKRVAECDWAYLRTLRPTTSRGGEGEGMARLTDLLGLLDQDAEAERVWVLIDIKVCLAPTYLTYYLPWSPVLPVQARG